MRFLSCHFCSHLVRLSISTSLFSLRGCVGVYARMGMYVHPSCWEGGGIAARNFVHEHMNIPCITNTGCVCRGLHHPKLKTIVWVVN